MGVVLTEDQLEAQIAEDRREGRSLAFANGCFDVLHVGHVRYLEGAAAEADRLIVAINDDESVRGMKGPNRPVLAAPDRAELVAALRAVDYVVVFPDSTVARLLERFKPDVHCKGTDYTVDTVPERETVRAYGGRIAIVGDPKDHSTTELLHKVAKSPNQITKSPNQSPNHQLKKSTNDMKLLIVRLGALGDIVHALPVAAALRDRYPDSRIDWLADARYAALLDLVPVVNRRIVISPGRKGGRGSDGPGAVCFPGRRGVLRAIRAMRAERYDAAIDLQGLVKSAALARASGAQRVIGFERRHLREGAAALFYNERYSPAGAVHVVHKNVAVLAAFGIHDARLSFPLSAGGSPVVERVKQELGGERRFALLNPGAAWPNKRWPPERFGALASWLRDRHGLRSLVLWGPGEERLARAVAGTSGGAAVAAPQTGLADLIALSRAARLMVSGDTGPLHLAAAAGTPIVALFGPTDPARNGPWAEDDIALSRYGECECHYQRRCRRERACMEDITLDDACAAVERRLSYPNGPLA